MTDQVLIKSKYAVSKLVDQTNVLGNEGLRVYRDSPFSIHVQVRTTTRNQGRISGFSLSADEARKVGEYLLKKADELRDDPGRVKAAA